MIKKIVIIIICLYFVIACGRKGDPEYKAANDAKIEDIICNI
tara:strand:+ start:121 stop:246 length:126 start_codon:yes stop_codon:yes gene_type:complete